MTLQTAVEPVSARRCLSDMEMDIYFLNTNSQGDDAVKQHIEACDICKARWEACRKDYAEFEARVFPQTVLRVVQRVSKEQRRATLLRFCKPSAALCAVAATALMIFVFSFSAHLYRNETQPEAKAPSQRASTPYIGEKGSLGMEVWCRRAGRVFRINEGDTVYPDDMIRFVPRFPENAPRYAMVVSRDGTGKISQYAPLKGNAAFVPSGEAFAGSIILDDAPGKEELFLLAATQPFGLEEARASVSASPDRTPARHGAEVSLLLEKTRLMIYKTATFESK